MITIDKNPVHNFQYIQNPNHGFNMALLDSSYRILHRPFECKDYLNDIFFAEYTGHPIEVYGLSWEKGRMPLGKKRYFLLALLGNGHNMRNRIPGMVAFLNKFEDAQGFKHTTILETDNDCDIVVRFPVEWTKSSWHMSTYATLVRLSAVFSPEEDVISYLKDVVHATKGGTVYPTSHIKYPDFMHVDMVRISKKSKIDRIFAVFSGEKMNRNWDYYIQKYHSAYELGMGVHNMGLSESSEFPTKEFPYKYNAMTGCMESNQ